MPMAAELPPTWSAIHRAEGGKKNYRLGHRTCYRYASQIRQPPLEYAGRNWRGRRLMGFPDSSETLDHILIEQLRSAGFVCSLPSRAILFPEGETARGVHILSRGHVKRSF